MFSFSILNPWPEREMHILDSRALPPATHKGGLILVQPEADFGRFDPAFRLKGKAVGKESSIGVDEPADHADWGLRWYRS